ncbi:MAG TPA: hypothetical protein VI306_13395 [Pyrinomonadaceae bacterium]
MQVDQIRFVLVLCVLFLFCHPARSQQPAYPKEVYGYKVERAAMVAKNVGDAEALVRFGEPVVTGVTPLSIKLEIPLIIAPITQKGRVELLMFEDMVVNGTPVEIEDYVREFNLPNKKELVLREPLRFSVNLPNAMLAGIGELTSAKERWLITGRVYVLGHYKKFMLSFKRAVPVEINFTMKNPLRQ